MSDKRPKGTFQDRYNKPDSAIPPLSERIFYMVFKYLQESFDFIKNGLCGQKSPHEMVNKRFIREVRIKRSICNRTV